MGQDPTRVSLLVRCLAQGFEVCSVFLILFITPEFVTVLEDEGSR